MIYVGVNDKAREVSKVYVGVNGKAAEVPNAYVGVNGRAKQCFSAAPKVWTWEEVAEAEANGTYRTKFKLGDQAVLHNDFFTNFVMEIVAFDTDNLADEPSKAKITWLSKDLVNGTYMNQASNASAGWEESSIRVTFLPLLLNKIPSEVVAMMKPVLKKYVLQDKTDSICTDTLFVPSKFEVSGQTPYPSYSCDVKYTEWFDAKHGTARRTKEINGRRFPWWTRDQYSVYTSTPPHFWVIYTDGSLSQHYASTSSHAVAFGFCT